MKKFFINTLLQIIKLIFMISLILIVFVYILSLKNNEPIPTTISTIQTLGKELIDFKHSDKNTVNILLDTNTNTGNTSSLTTSNNMYYYEQLNENAKIIYNTLENNINNLVRENYIIDFSTNFNDLLHETTGQYKLDRAFQSALDAFFYDHPELFYLDITNFSLIVKCNSIGPIKKYTIQIVPKDNKNYLNPNFTSEQEVKNAINEIESTKNNIINSIAKEKTYQKIFKVHNILVNSLKYDQTLNKPNAHNIYGALVKKEAVCDGYAKAFKYILDSLDINCILVSGTATNSYGKTESHMWNYVEINNTWYAIDCTWDDPVIIGQPSSNKLSHKYFLKGNSTFAKSHIPSGNLSENGMSFTFPTLSSRDY